MMARENKKKNEVVMSDLKTKPLPRYPKDENELGFKTCFFEQDNTAC
jgi:hypothetical protein